MADRMTPSERPTPSQVDVAVIGAGPAGSTAGRLLAEWGYTVSILSGPNLTGVGPVETLPPSTRKVFDFLGIQAQVDGAEFCPTSGNTVWWAGSSQRVENYSSDPKSWGYQVDRHRFDRLLLDLAVSSGARVKPHTLVSRVDVDGDSGAAIIHQVKEGKKWTTQARFVLDCSGRAGVIARQGLRNRETDCSTVAIMGLWQDKSGWELPDISHTLVESYCDGWVWSVPLEPKLRYFTVMVDPRRSHLQRGQAWSSIYLQEINKTVACRRLLSGSRLQNLPRARDATIYSAKTYAGSKFLLLGDAASFIDPLSSFGVKKALASAWVGAVVVNTVLKRPAMHQVACDFHSEREEEVYKSYRERSLDFFLQAAAAHDSPFWRDRAAREQEKRSVAETEQDWQEDSAVQQAFAQLRAKETIRLRWGNDTRIERKAGVSGREIVMEEAAASAGLPDGLRFVKGVELPTLLRLAGDYRQVPQLFSAYNQRCGEVGLPDFLTALSVLLARGVLVDEGR